MQYPEKKPEDILLPEGITPQSFEQPLTPKEVIVKKTSDEELPLVVALPKLLESSADEQDIALLEEILNKPDIESWRHPYEEMRTAWEEKKKDIEVRQQEFDADTGLVARIKKTFGVSPISKEDERQQEKLRKETFAAFRELSNAVKNQIPKDADWKLEPRMLRTLAALSDGDFKLETPHNPLLKNKKIATPIPEEMPSSAFITTANLEADPATSGNELEKAEDILEIAVADGALMGEKISALMNAGEKKSSFFESMKTFLASRTSKEKFTFSAGIIALAISLGFYLEKSDSDASPEGTRVLSSAIVHAVHKQEIVPPGQQIPAEEMINNAVVPEAIPKPEELMVKKEVTPIETKADEIKDVLPKKETVQSPKKIAFIRDSLGKKGDSIWAVLKNEGVSEHAIANYEHRHRHSINSKVQRDGDQIAYEYKDSLLKNVKVSHTHITKKNKAITPPKTKHLTIVHHAVVDISVPPITKEKKKRSRSKTFAEIEATAPLPTNEGPDINETNLIPNRNELPTHSTSIESETLRTIKDQFRPEMWEKISHLKIASILSMKNNSEFKKTFDKAFKKEGVTISATEATQFIGMIATLNTGAISPLQNETVLDYITRVLQVNDIMNKTSKN